ncbi:MAG TPA: SMC-Scp complex subunit ScpB [Candidatus Kapabacteria bacterium]|nr:SMC-Scp complex subunit ScpB [Candidatus Kapabacteria bacterium]HPO61851.1 SMC-Scp complex subunit ScpB [Candidatus Kapabacteria bacterium]
MEKQIEASGFNFLNLSKNEQKATLEAIIFAAEEPITIKSLFSILVTGDKLKSSKKLSEEKELVIESDELKNKQKDYNDFFIDLINEINEELISTNRPFRIVEIAGGFQYATRPEFGMYIEKLFSNKIKKRLTQASIETLSIIAYKQPVTKPEIEQIRGVNSSEIINSLVEKNLVETAGRKDVVGKPLLYKTTDTFLKVFGLQALDDLPRLKDFDEIES